MTFLKIAWRNITRSKRRSCITISAVGFGVGALIFIWGFVEGAHRQMIENYTSLLTSDIQIHQKGFHQSQKLETHLLNPETLLVALEKNAQIKANAPRIKAVGLVSSSESSSGVMILGVDPEKESSVSTLHRRIKTGAFLDMERDSGIILGATLAKNLNVSIDDKIVLMSQALDGSIASGAFIIQGLLDTGTEEIDKGLALITLRAAQELFVMPRAISEIAIRLNPAAESRTTARKLKDILPQNSDLEILPWQEVSPSFQQWIEFDNGFIWIIVFVVMIVVAIGILNTVLMGVLERTREFGILLALGTKRQEIITMVAWESFFLGTIGSLMGLLLGLALNTYFGKTGIDLTAFTKALNSFYIDSVIYPSLNVTHSAVSVMLVLTTSIVVSIYPAFHAANLKPVEAIRSL